MNMLQAIFLGLIQGLTEFIPVSSSGHLVLAHHFFGIEQTGLSFDVALHLGTLVALLIYFRHEVISFSLAIFDKKRAEHKIAWMLAMATVPAVIVGVLLESAAETAFRSPKLVAINLAVVGFIMIIAEKYYHAKVLKPTKFENTKRNQALAVGLAQAAAIVPGVSRSGSTITTGLFMGMDRVGATRFSFLLGIPIIGGAVLKVVSEGSVIGQVRAEWSLFLVGILTALFSGLFAIRFMLGFLGQHSLASFAYYRIAVSAIVLIVLAVS